MSKSCSSSISTRLRLLLQVRYESRRRLAEARPRVKGQFVKAEVAASFNAQQAAEEGVQAAQSSPTVDAPSAS